MNAETKKEKTKLWLTNAVGFFRAAQAYFEKYGSEIPFPWPAFYANICLSYEMSLKAFLVYNGFSDGDLRAIGHDLDKAFSQAIENNFDNEIPELAPIISALNKYHNPRKDDPSFRYLKNEPYDVPGGHWDTLKTVGKHLLNVGRQTQIFDL